MPSFEVKSTQREIPTDSFGLRTRIALQELRVVI
jgi:hypothetical protein